MNTEYTEKLFYQLFEVLYKYKQLLPNMTHCAILFASGEEEETRIQVDTSLVGCLQQPEVQNVLRTFLDFLQTTLFSHALADTGLD